MTSSMQEKIEDLRKRREQAFHAGSPHAVERQHAKGKMLARERIDYLLDPGSFNELDLLARHRALVAGLNDGAGARIQEGVVSLASYGGIFYRNVLSSGVVPQISVILGPCAGGAVYSPAMTDFIFMVRESSHMFITGPDVVKTVTGEDVTLEELGGAMSHATKSGVATFVSPDEKSCLEDVRYLLSFLPSNILEDAPT